MKQTRSGTTSPRPAPNGKGWSASRIIFALRDLALSLRIRRLKRRERYLEQQLDLPLEDDDKDFLIARGFFPGRGAA